MAKGNHSFYEEVKKSDESGNFSFSKFLKGIRKYGKWVLFSFLTVVTLWGCAAEFIHTTTQQVSRGLEFYGNKQTVVPNMYKGQKSTFSYQIVATGDNPFTDDIEEDNFLLPFEIYRPNYDYLLGINNENMDPEDIDYNFFTTPGENIADYQISLLSSTANLSFSTYYSTAFLGYDWSNVDLRDDQYLIMPFNIDYFSGDVKKQFYQYSLEDSGFNLEDYDVYNENTNPYGNDDQEIDSVEFYAYLADNNPVYSDQFLSYIQAFSYDENDNVIDSNDDGLVNGDDYYSNVQKGFAYYTGPLFDFSNLDSTSKQTFTDSYNQVGNVDPSNLINPLNWVPVDGVIYLHQLSEDQNEDSAKISEDKYNLYQSEVKLYTNILAYYGGTSSQTGGDFNSIADNFSLLTENYQYDFEKIIDYNLDYSDQDQVTEDITIPSNVDRTVNGIISYIFYQDSSPPSPGDVDYTVGFNFLISPYSLNILNGIWGDLESADLVVGTSYDVINSRSVSDPSEVFYPSQKSMQLITGYNYQNDVYNQKTTYQSNYDYDSNDGEEYTTYENVDALRPSDWMDGTKAGQASRTNYSGWAFMEEDQNSDWQLIELASNKPNADTIFDPNAFLYFGSTEDFDNNNFSNFFTTEGQNLIANYLIDYSQYINIGYEFIYLDDDNQAISDLSDKSTLTGDLDFYTPFVGISTTFDTDSQSGSINPLVETTANFGITASLYTILNQAEGNGLNSNHEVFTDDIGDWQDAWDPAYGPMYGLFVWPLAQLSIIIQSVFPIGAVWGVILGIFLITFILRGIGYAMSFGSNKNQSKMQEVQTQVAQINAKYQQYDKKNKQMKMRKQQETMALYRKNNVNPFASLGTIFVTMPIFLSIWIIISALPAYKIISVGQFSFSVSAISGMFSVGSLFFAYLFVGIAVGFAQGLSSKLPRMLSNKRKGIKRIDEQTKKAMKKQNKTQNIMIGVFIFMGLIVPVLLAIYWIFSALFTMTTEIIKHAVIQHKAKKEG